MAQHHSLGGRFWVSVVLCGLALGGCSGSSSGPVAPPPPPPPPPPAAAKLAFIVQPSNAVAGAANTPGVQVAIQDAQGNTVTTATNSITVAIGTNPASGTLSGTMTVAAVNGVATFSTLNINRAAAGYTLSASAASLTSATSNTFNISAGAAAKLLFTVQPSNAAAGATNAPAVQVTVQDALGNTVTTATTSITLAIGTNPASGTLSGTMTVAAISGVATFSTLSLDKSGTGYTLTAAANGLVGATSNAFTIGVGAAAKLLFTLQPSNAVAGAANTPAVQVTVQDAQGNTVTTANTSITVAIGTNPASGVLSGTMTLAAISGVATFSTLSLNRTGTGYTLTASAASLTSATSNAFDISAGAAAKVVFTVQPSNAGAGAANTPAVQASVEDAQGNTVTTATTIITVAIGTNPASGILSGTMTVAAISGVATFSTLSLNKAGTGYTLTGSATGLTGATSTAFNISAGAEAKLVFTVQPSDAAAGAAITPALQVAVQDAQGNTVTTATTSIMVAIGTNPNGGTLSGTTTAAAVNGVATFSNLSIDPAGTGYTLTASATGLTGATSSAFNVVGPPPGRDIVVFNDYNLFDNTGMGNDNNHILVANLVTYTASGPRASGSVVAFDRGRDSRCGTDASCDDDNLSTMRSVILNQTGISSIIELNSTSGSITTIDPNVKVLFLWNPLVTYTVAEINTLKQFASEDGRLVFIGEWDGYYGAGIQLENQFLANMGAGMTNIGQAVDCATQSGYPDLPATSLRPHQITAGMNGIRIACASVIEPGSNDYILLFDSSNSKALAGVARINIAPILTARPAVAGAAPTRSLQTSSHLNPSSSTGH